MKPELKHLALFLLGIAKYIACVWDMEIEYDKPIEVSELKYRFLMAQFCGIIAGRKSADGKFYIKVWFMKYAHLIKKYL